MMVTMSMVSRSPTREQLKKYEAARVEIANALAAKGWMRGTTKFDSVVSQKLHKRFGSMNSGY